MITHDPDAIRSILIDAALILDRCECRSSVVGREGIYCLWVRRPGAFHAFTPTEDASTLHHGASGADLIVTMNGETGVEGPGAQGIALTVLNVVSACEMGL